MKNENKAIENVNATNENNNGKENLTPESQTQYDTPDPLAPKRNGKISRLNRDIREALNRQLRANDSAEDILEWLNDLPAVKAILDKEFEGEPISRQNLAHWRSGGYRDWENQQCAYLRLEKEQREITEKGGNPYQLGYELAQLHAGEYLATLTELVTKAPNAEERMKRLSKAMTEFRGWRRADYQAERMALEKEKWEWQCQKEIAAEEKAEETQECWKISRWLGRFMERKGQPPSFADRAIDAAWDLDALGELRKEAWKIEDEIAAEKAQSKKHKSEVREPSGPQKSTQSGQSGNHLSPIEGVKVGQGESEKVGTEGEEKAGAGLAKGEKTIVGNQQLASPEAVKLSENNLGSEPQPGKRVLLSYEEATRVVAELAAKAKKNGLRAPKPEEVAALGAYLCGRGIKWLNNQTDLMEVMPPPAKDPRLDPAAPGHGLWSKLANIK